MDNITRDSEGYRSADGVFAEVRGGGDRWDLIDEGCGWVLGSRQVVVKVSKDV